VDRVNLIPAPRRQAAARRLHLRHWSAGMLLYFGALAAVYTLCHRSLGDRSAALAQASGAVQQEIEVSNRLQGALDKAIAAAAWRLDSARFIGKSPDWSVLLALAARQLGDEVVLEKLLLAPVKLGGAEAGRRKAAPDATDAELFVLELSGVAKSQTAVSEFILRLEKTKLFDRVRLIQTDRGPFLGGSGVTFRLECTFEGAGTKGR